MNINDVFNAPIDAGVLLQKKKRICKELLQQEDLKDIRIAILNGSTSQVLQEVLEIFLLKQGLKPTFYESQYNRFYEEAVFTSQDLIDFRPEIIYVHTTCRNIVQYPGMLESKDAVERKAQDEFGKYQLIWEKLFENCNCQIIQNNFDFPPYRLLGNNDSSDHRGRIYFINRLNQLFVEHSVSNQKLIINDINYLAAKMGLENWHDPAMWYSYKYALGFDGFVLLSQSLSKIIGSIYGVTKKCLVCDLDNTMWGGIIGDDGVENIKIGKETPEAEAFSDFQKYIKELKEQGVILAVNSKNEYENAKKGFEHPDSILKESDFAAFQANWLHKPVNLVEIAQQLNIGTNSMVFVDDNPSERELVKSQLPEIEVPDIGNDVGYYIRILDQAGYFESVSLSGDDLIRSKLYEDNAKRKQFQEQAESYDAFLESLEMECEVAPFSDMYLDRITQLVNKTNQFNLTTRRYSFADIEKKAKSADHITLYGRLKDRFGDNGLISVVSGIIENSTLHIDLWLMSCRVFQRQMEYAMFDELVRSAIRQGSVINILGYYYETAKNGLVKNFYEEIGFQRTENLASDADSVWEYQLPVEYEPKNKFIKILDKPS